MGVSGSALSRERADHVAAEEAWDLKKAALESNLVRVVGLIRNYDIGCPLISCPARNLANTTKPVAPLEHGK